MTTTKMDTLDTPPQVLITGFGDIGRRVARLLVPRHPVRALSRRLASADETRMRDVEYLSGDLADLASLVVLGKGTPPATTVFHFAPPPLTGLVDTHTRNLIAALDQIAPPGLPAQFIYISTTGVYGDCGGAWIDESLTVNPQTDRARRRVDAEQVLAEWATRRSIALTILRVPGIYAMDRLPLARLQAGTPVIAADEDTYTNHIHADDLAQACVASMALRGHHTLNIVDDSDLKAGDYFDLAADYFHLSRPPRLSRREAQIHLPAISWSFLNESRRINNARMKEILGLHLHHPTIAAFLATNPRNTG